MRGEGEGGGEGGRGRGGGDGTGRGSQFASADRYLLATRRPPFEYRRAVRINGRKLFTRVKFAVRLEVLDGPAGVRLRQTGSSRRDAAM